MANTDVEKTVRWLIGKMPLFPLPLSKWRYYRDKYRADVFSHRAKIFICVVYKNEIVVIKIERCVLKAYSRDRATHTHIRKK